MSFILVVVQQQEQRTAHNTTTVKLTMGLASSNISHIYENHTCAYNNMFIEIVCVNTSTPSSKKKIYICNYTVESRFFEPPRETKIVCKM